MGKFKNSLIELMSEQLTCKPNIDCACKVGNRCKYFDFEGTLQPECKDPYTNTEELYYKK
jgi:hypothetical protein